MRTVDDRMAIELLLLKDYLDALETSLVTVDDKTPAHHEASQQLLGWWEQVAEIECREIRYATDGKDALRDIITLAETVIVKQRQWPAASNLFDTDEYAEAIEDSEELLKNALKAYDAKRYLKSVAVHSPTMSSEEQADARYAAFNKAFEDLGEGANRQEAIALYRWELNALSKGATSVPGPREVFDPAHVEIKRHWRSATELVTILYYDSEFIGNFQDEAILHPLGFYHPKMNEFEACQAVRKIFYLGHPTSGLAPLNRSTPTGQYQRLVADISIAQDQCEQVPDLMPRIGGICEEIALSDSTLTLAAGGSEISAPAPASP